MAQLNPYITFNGNSREAMEFYKACLGGELSIMTVGDSPVASQMPDKKDNVLHSTLKKDGMVLMASDKIMPGELIQGNTITVCIIGGTKEELQQFFAKLSEGGTVGQPLTESFFGTFGELKDKFGIDWMFQADNA